jgi:hypothetical protein
MRNVSTLAFVAVAPFGLTSVSEEHTASIVSPEDRGSMF